MQGSLSHCDFRRLGGCEEVLDHMSRTMVVFPGVLSLAELNRKLDHLVVDFLTDHGIPVSPGERQALVDNFAEEARARCLKPSRHGSVGFRPSGVDVDNHVVTAVGGRTGGQNGPFGAAALFSSAQNPVIPSVGWGTAPCLGSPLEPWRAAMRGGCGTASGGDGGAAPLLASAGGGRRGVCQEGAASGLPVPRVPPGPADCSASGVRVPRSGQGNRYVFVPEFDAPMAGAPKDDMFEGALAHFSAKFECRFATAGQRADARLVPRRPWRTPTRPRHHSAPGDLFLRCVCSCQEAECGSLRGGDGSDGGIDLLQLFCEASEERFRVKCVSHFKERALEHFRPRPPGTDGLQCLLAAAEIGTADDGDHDGDQDGDHDGDHDGNHNPDNDNEQAGAGGGRGPFGGGFGTGARKEGAGAAFSVRGGVVWAGGGVARADGRLARSSGEGRVSVGLPPAPLGDPSRKPLRPAGGPHKRKPVVLPLQRRTGEGRILRLGLGSPHHEYFRRCSAAAAASNGSRKKSRVLREG